MLAPARDGNGATLLGHDQAERVGPLGQAQGGGVARAAAREFLEVLRERQMDAQFVDPVALDDDRAVVAEGMGIEYALEQRFAEAALDVLAAFQVPRDHVVSAHDHERADAGAGQVAQRAGQDLHLAPGQAAGVPFVTGQAALAPPQADALEEVAQVLLKDDHQRHQDDREETLQQRDRERESELAARPDR